MTEQPTGRPTGQPAGQPAWRPTAGAAGQKRLVRSRDDRMVAGVCGGIAQYLGVDATLVRILVVVGTVLGFGSLVLAYVIGWVLIPEEE
jgi:phage shock protein PspC (stress-responsive transcriptional regulator)